MQTLAKIFSQKTENYENYSKDRLFLTFCVRFCVCLCVCVSVRAFVIEIFLVHHGVRKIPLPRCIPLREFPPGEFPTYQILTQRMPPSKVLVIVCAGIGHWSLDSGHRYWILEVSHGSTGFTELYSFTRLHRISLKILKSTIFIADQCRICNFYGDYGDSSIMRLSLAKDLGLVIPK